MACAGSAGGSRPPHGHAFRLPADCEDNYPEDDDVEEQQQPQQHVPPQKKQGERGHAKGKSLSAVRAGLGWKKVPLTWDERFPVTIGRYAKMYKSELGHFVRARCKPYINDWAHVPDSAKNSIWHYMDDNFEPVEEELVKYHASFKFRSWKSELKSHAIESTIIPPPRPATVTSDEDWELFLRRIEDPAFQERCKQNALNRAKQKYPSLHGRTPMASHRHNNKKDSISTWEDKHKKNDSFVNQTASENYNKLKQTKEKVAPGDQPPSHEQEREIFREALGQRHDYHIGLGPTQPQKVSRHSQQQTGSSSQAFSREFDLMKNKNRRLEKKQEKIEKSNRKLKNVVSSMLGFIKSMNPNYKFPSFQNSDDDDDNGDDDGDGEGDGDNNDDVEDLENDS